MSPWKLVVTTVIPLGTLILLATLILPACSKADGDRSPPLSGSGRALALKQPLKDFASTKKEDGVPMGSKELKGSVWIASFIFTRCPTMCPTMTRSMAKIQKATQDLGKDLQLVSFTVDPEFDTLERLTRLAASNQADPERWHFLRTETIEQINDLQADGFGLGRPGTPAAHSPRFILVDKEGNIRRYRDGQSAEECALLIEDARTLIKTGKLPE